MTAISLNRIRSLVYQLNPLIHAITNPISINQCANTVLAVGAQPIMAEHPEEVSDITLSSSALLLNLGNITDTRMESMRISAKTAKQNNIPFVLDAVGVACSEFRRKYALSITEKFKPHIIKGNYSEITALNNPAFKSAGVDTAASLTVNETTHAAIQLAEKYETVILASGKADIVTDGKKILLVQNGTQQLSRITGSGCMLGILCATYLSSALPLDAAVCACSVLGVCGELSATDKGNGTFSSNLMDKLSTLTNTDLKNYLNIKEKNIETH